MEHGYIALHRKLLTWEWFTDINVCHLFIYCLLRANYKPNKWRGYDIPRGGFITSLNHIASDTGLSVRQVRTAINKLKATGELTHKTTSRNSIIIIKNWDKFQLDDTHFDTQMTRKRQTNDTQVTTDNKENKENKENNIINLSLSSKNITNREREILKSYCKRIKIKNVNAYIRKIIDNGDYIQLVEEELRHQNKLFQREQIKRQEQIEVKESPEVIEQAYLKFKNVFQQRSRKNETMGNGA